MTQKILNTYINIFEEFNNENIKYFIYKGLDKLETHLSGGAGDIDVFIEPSDIQKVRNIILKHGVKDVSNFIYKNSFFGIDSVSGKTVLIDICTSIHLFRKPFLQYSGKIEIDYSQIQIVKNIDNINVLHPSEYTALLILIRSTGKSQILGKIQEIKKIIKENKINTNTYLWKTAGTILQEKSSDILSSYEKNILNGKYKKKIISSTSNFIGRFFWENLRNATLLVRFISGKIGVPAYRVRKIGFLVAFTGVDGSGKSSAVDMIHQNIFFKLTGVKKIYFGNNNYWIPGLHYALKHTNNTLLKIILSIFVRIDRQLRIFGAIYYMLLGNIVIADRYYYDDMLVRNPFKNGSFKHILYQIYLSIFKVRMLRKPEISFYMDVSPEVAYKRKQDYDFKTMQEMNTLYSNLMKTREEVTFINADQDIKQVHEKIINIIYNYK